MLYLIEALVVGALTVIIGLLVSYGVMYVVDPESAKKFNHWWSIVASFFVTGFIIHLLCEFSGINHWYCNNGNACRL
jgi:ABC-type antimicrobial peptide transport system permease subunit